MFFKQNQRSTPTVKVRKASDIINNSSHKQKKYFSLMLVPSYTSGKTRSIRVPRSVFYCVVVSLFVISSVIAGLQIRANYFMRTAEEFQTRLIITEEELEYVISSSEEELNEWIAANQLAVDQLGEEHLRNLHEERRQRREYQETLNELQDLLDALERQITEFDEDLTAAIAGLTVRSFIPPVAALLERLNESQTELRSLFQPEAPAYRNGYANGYTDGQPVALASTAPSGDIVLLSALALPPPVSESDLRSQIESHKRTLEMLNAQKDDFMEVHALILPYDKNYPTLWPVRAEISSGFGSRRCPFGSGQWQHHTGIDIQSPRGTSIRAAGGGVVTFAGWASGGFGNKVIIDHGFGMRTLYAHNSANLVVEGQRVERGQIIARVGATGSTTGNHLHYEVHQNGRPVNPRTFLLE
jgi:murein DD-endopeptidase MepM/ murein hydrolase activator NlpD